MLRKCANKQPKLSVKIINNTPKVKNNNFPDQYRTSPLVSVIIPCYKQAHFLNDALQSVYDQTIQNWECIIVDDGSPDNTKKVAYNWIYKDRRYRYFCQNNRGLSSARNLGLSVAYGEFIQFLDADDFILPEKFEKQTYLLQDIENLCFCYCDYKRGTVENIFTEPKSFSPYLPPPDASNFMKQMANDWETRISIPPHCFLFDSRIFRVRKIKFDIGLANHEDWDCWMQIAILFDLQVVSIAEKLAIYRYSNSSMSYDRRPMRDGFLKAIDKQIRLNKKNPDLLALLKHKRIETIESYRDVMDENRFYEKLYRKMKQKLKKIIPEPVLNFLTKGIK